MQFIPFVVGFVMSNLPQLWDVLKTTIEAVGVHFHDSPPEERKALVVKNITAWYALVDKQMKFKDEDDAFFLNHFMPDAVEWVYAALKFDIKSLVEKIFVNQVVLDSADKSRILAGNMAIHADPGMPSQAVVVSLIDGQNPLEPQDIQWPGGKRPEGLPLLDNSVTENAFSEGGLAS